MRARGRLLCIVTHAWTVIANVEKTIFLGPSPVALPHVHSGLDELRLDTLDPANTSVLPTQLPVHFASASAPRGLESWYILRGLDDGRRYEVRICWPATQPTDFWLETFTITEISTSPALLASLSKYNQVQQALHTEGAAYKAVWGAVSQSTLLLRVQAAASFYSTNRTLMEYPRPVDVDIILDPFILNIFPQSLVPTAVYILVVSIGAWLLSGYIYRWLLSTANELSTNDHKD